MNQSTIWKNKTVGVVGIGPRTGVALVKFLCAHGARVVVYDDRPSTELISSIHALQDCNYALETNTTQANLLDSAELIVVSPGVEYSKSYLNRARNRGIPVISEIEFASAQIQTPLLAITGSNGKSTTTALLGHILTGWKKEVFVGGNLGTPLITAVDRTYDFVVVEVSSFQLETIDQFHPHVGILTNISPNHLDRHKNMSNYVALKERMFCNMTKQDYAVVNLQNETCQQIAKRLSTTVWRFSFHAHTQADIWIENGMIRSAHNADKVSLEKFRLPGQHNQENALAACAAALATGCPAHTIEDQLSSFRALSHRLEPLATLDEIHYVNDSKSTTPTSTICALKSFQTPIIWIAGGRSKNFDYTELATAAQTRVKKAILFGESAQTMASSLTAVPHTVVKDLSQAFREAKFIAISGDVVLFSPANTSFDQYRDYEERGNHFSNLVLKKAQE